MPSTKIIGPFIQLLTMNYLPIKGPLSDKQLEVIPNGGIVVSDGLIVAIGNFNKLCSDFEELAEIEYVDSEMVATPGFVDPHTHICWAGSRANDYALRLAGSTYLEIAQSGGGIASTVSKTRAASSSQLEKLLIDRAMHHLKNGVTTIEVKSGYGLNTSDELKILEAINAVNHQIPVDLIPSCLAAHIKPNDFNGSQADYLEVIVQELLPEILKRNLAARVDIFIDKGAFSPEEGRIYLQKAKHLGFIPVVHGEQFTPGGVAVAVDTSAVSVDHLEAINAEGIAVLLTSNVIPIALPGASIGLGYQFAPARRLLDSGCSLAIGSDWNPGSAPMGDLLMQAAILGIYEKMSMAETFAAITVRAAAALDLSDRGVLKKDYIADFIGFSVSDYREILYNQGSVKPVNVWKKGENQG